LGFGLGTRQERVTVERFVTVCGDSLRLHLLAGKGGVTREIPEAALNRPGLALAGFYEHFSPTRLQIIGMHEHAYLSKFKKKNRQERIRQFFANNVPGVVICRELPLFDEWQTLANETNTPLMLTPMETHYFFNAATLFMEELFGVHETVHGTMMEVYGEGILLVGEAGVGKSETALGLIKRGHALVADDSTMLRRDRFGRIMASPVAPTTNFMEIRGIGIVHVPSIFGITAVRGQKQLDLVITLERSKQAEADLDRTGDVWAYRNVLSLRIPDITVVVAAGRDVVNLVETAVCEFKLRMLGQSSSQKLDDLIISRNQQLTKEAAQNANEEGTM